MTIRRRAIHTLIGVLISVIAYGQNDKAVSEYLDVPGPIVLNGSSFTLAWSLHPSAVYYKQEYLDAKNTLERFKKMILLEVLVGESKAADLANAKIAELKQLKASDPIINYDVFQKNGEIIVDFLVNERSPDGKKINIIERNIYRYKNITEKNGKKGVLLFGVSERAYGNAVDAFLYALKKTGSVLTNAVAAFAMPEITIKK